MCVLTLLPGLNESALTLPTCTNRIAIIASVKIIVFMLASDVVNRLALNFEYPFCVDASNVNCVFLIDNCERVGVFALTNPAVYKWVVWIVELHKLDRLTNQRFESFLNF